MVWIAQESFASGEISPSLYGLVSSRQYRAGCMTLQNALLTPTGSVRKRYGTKLVNGTTNDYPAAIFFYFAKGRQFVVQFVSQDDDAGDLNTAFRQVRVIDCVTRLFIDFGDNAAHGPFSAFGDASAYHHHFLASELPDIYSFQDNERIFFLHKNHPPIFLERRVFDGTELWDYGIAPDVQTTPVVVSYRQDANITEKAGNNGIESDLDIFEKGDEGAYWRIGGPAATGNYGSWYRTDTYESGKSMAGGRVSNVAPGGDPSDWCGPFLPSQSSTVNFTLNANSTAVGDSRTVTCSASIVRRNLIGTPLTIASQLWIVTAVTSSTVFTAERLQGGATITNTAQAGNFLVVGGPLNLKARPYLRVNPITVTGDTGSVDIHSVTPVFAGGLGADSAWLPDGHETTFDDVAGTAIGGTVHFSGGIVALTALDTASGIGSTEPTYTGQVVRTPALYGPSLNWGLGHSVAVGFPRCGVSHQGRIFLGGYKEVPTKVVGSRTLRTDDFTTGDLDDDGLEFEIADPLGGRVSWMESGSDLLVGTDTAEFSLGGRPITPSEFASERQSSYGGRNVRPALVGASAMFIGAGGKSLREMTYMDERQRYHSPDLTELAKHIFEDIVIAEMAYVSDPAQILYVRDTANRMYALSMWRDNGVTGWSRFTQPVLPVGTNTSTEASTIESMCAVRADGTDLQRDELWVVRRMTVGGISGAGTVVRRIERMSPEFPMDLTTDGATPSTTQTTFSTLVDVANAQVMVQENAGDEFVYIGDLPVSLAGLVNYPTLPFTPNAAQGGLQIEFKLVPVIPHLAIEGEGDTQGRLENVSAVIVLVRESRGGTVSGSKLMAPGVNVPNATTPTTAVPDFTGWRKVVSVGTFGVMHEIPIVQTDPYHFEVAGLNFQLTHGR